MTLRNVGSWLSDLVGDVNTMFTENILDWPIWTVVVAIILGFVTIGYSIALVAALLGKLPKAVKVYIKLLLHLSLGKLPMVVEEVMVYILFGVSCLLLSAGTVYLFITIADVLDLTGSLDEEVASSLALVIWAIIFAVLIYLRNLGRKQDN